MGIDQRRGECFQQVTIEFFRYRAMTAQQCFHVRPGLGRGGFYIIV